MSEVGIIITIVVSFTLGWVCNSLGRVLFPDPPREVLKYSKVLPFSLAAIHEAEEDAIAILGMSIEEAHEILSYAPRREDPVSFRNDIDSPPDIQPRPSRGAPFKFPVVVYYVRKTGGGRALYHIDEHCSEIRGVVELTEIGAVSPLAEYEACEECVPTEL